MAQVKLTAIDGDGNQGFCYLTIRIFELESDSEHPDAFLNNHLDSNYSKELPRLLQQAGLDSLTTHLDKAGISDMQDLRDLLMGLVNDN